MSAAIPVVDDEDTVELLKRKNLEIPGRVASLAQVFWQKREVFACRILQYQGLNVLSSGEI